MNLQMLVKTVCKITLILAAAIPLIMFLNRVLIPDNSFDSVNYHLFLGYRGWHAEPHEFYPTGIHNFAPLIDMVNIPLLTVLGYRLGTIASLFYLYGCIWILYKIFKLYCPEYQITDSLPATLLLANCIFSFEMFLQIATYYTDIAVAFWMLLAVYLLLVYERAQRLRYLLLSSLVMAVVLVAKFTTWYLVVPYYGYLLLILVRSRHNVLTILKRLTISALISTSMLIPWLVHNYQTTHNPVFPFYNAIFKSEYFPYVNFEQTLFGGKNLKEKILWAWASAKSPVRLGEVHDLYHDYKINAYFVIALMVWLVSYLKKDSGVMRLTSLYLATYLCWSLTFGYLRYGIALELWGGVLLLVAYARERSKLVKSIIVIILAGLLLQDKRLTNMSLAYDISFRPNYVFNQQKYVAEIDNLFNNQIIIDNHWLTEYQPTVYLNCAAPSMTYYALSNVRDLPVLNIALSPYADLVRNSKYKKRSIQKLGSKTNNFVTIVGSYGLVNTYDTCIQSINERGYHINKIVNNIDMLGYSGQKLTVIFGSM